ncbi:MAG: acyl-CoA synthetase (AMP-forming)/AMP-acid ligase II [Paracoccaceae bacterium]|jgi:acyl-CoA synthetase (AMP-forming)/AMP-acid ligase II
MNRMFDYVEKAAFHRPDAPSLTFLGESFTWAQTHSRCRAMAAKLHELGVGRGDLVAHLGFNSHHLFELYFIPSLVGAASVPINYRLSEAEIVEILRDCNPTILIADAAHMDMARAVAAQVESVTVIMGAGEMALRPGELSYDDIANGAVQHLDPALAGQDDDTIILLYTGGTTGQPKGVELSHSNVLSNALGTLAPYGFKESETHLVSGPLFHAGSGSRVYSAVVLGAHTVIMQRFDPAEMLRLVTAHGVNVAQTVPTVLVMILDHPDFADSDLSSLRMMTYGAAPIPEALLSRVMKEMPQIKFAQAYGMTEASPVLTVLTAEYHTLEGPFAGKMTSVGRICAHVDLRIVDTAGRAVPTGEVGEIVARGPNVARGYRGNAAQTALSFREGWYHTGDSGYLDAGGFLYVVGCIKDMIISGGENVYPIEVENVISLHPAIAAVAVIGVPDDKWGEAVHAVVVLKPAANVSAKELIEHARARIAHYKCPRGVTFTTNSLPLTPINKIDKVALREAYAKGAL